MSEKQATTKNASHIKDKNCKHINSVSKQVNGPPSKVEAFSPNWKRFLDNQQKNVQPVQTKQKHVKNTAEIPITQKKLRVLKLNSNGGKLANVRKQNKIGKSRDRKRKRTHEKETEIKCNEIWFDVNSDLLPTASSRSNISSITATTNVSANHADSQAPENINKKENKSLDSNLTRHVALDCEMVGVGMHGKESILARVSIVNSLCECIYDKYVAPKEKVIDYRTHVSGICPSDLNNASDYFLVQKEVSDLLTDRVLVGHALQNDLKVLMLSHSKKYIRDTSKYKPFQKLLRTKHPALKRLAEEILHKEIQVGAHDSVVDAQITMQLYKKYKKEWEKSLHMKGWR